MGTEIPFKTWSLFSGPTAQTLLGALPRPGLEAFAKTAQERWFQLPDGARLLARSHGLGAGRPTVVILHGLTGDSESRYALGMARALVEQGFAVVRLNGRGARGTEAFSRGLHHAARSNDALWVLEELAGEVPALYLIGFSLGGAIALRLAGQAADRLPPELRAVLAVSPPLDLEACAQRLLTGRLNGLLTRRFLRSFAETCARTEAPFRPELDPERIAKLPSVLEFDRLVTAPMAGYPSLEAYYTDAAPLTWIQRARVPALLLHSLDDPLIDPRGVEDPRLLSRPAIRVEALPRGGHVGFIGPPRRRGSRYYAETRCAGFLLEAERLRTGLGQGPDLKTP